MKEEISARFNFYFAIFLILVAIPLNIFIYEQFNEPYDALRDKLEHYQSFLAYTDAEVEIKREFIRLASANVMALETSRLLFLKITTLIPLFGAFYSLVLWRVNLRFLKKMREIENGKRHV